MRHATSRLGILAITCAATALAAAQPVSTGWTYQGQLKDAGAPAGGDYDMIFVLYDAASGGSRVGPPLRFDGGPGNPPPVTIVDGLFTVELDFGAGIFTGDALWLQVAVRRTRVGGYSTLDPRQPLTAAPYALFALNGPGGGGGNWDLNGNDIFNNNSGNVGIGTTTPTDRLHVRGTQPTLRLDDDVDPGSFTEIKDAGTVQLRINKTNISGQVLLDINPKATDGTSDVQVRFFRETNTTGPKTVQFLRGNFSTETSARIAVDGGDSFFQAHGGNLGIGTTAPAARLHVAGVAGEDGIMFPDGTLQTTAAGPGGGLWSANANDIFYNNGNVGIGTATPQTMLDIFGEDAVLRVESIRNDFGPKLVFRNRTSGSGVYQGTIQFQDANITLAEVGYRRPRFGVPRLSLVTAGGGIAIFDGGEVGIGDVPTPDAKLHVVGGATSAIFGTTSATGATDAGVRGESLSTSGGSGILAVGRFGVNGIANTLNGFGGVFSGGGEFGSGPSLWAVGDALVSAGLRVGSTGVFEPATVKLHVENGDDVSPEGGGFVVIGDFGRLNIGIDGNEIMARNNGAVSTLFLNHEGGDVRIGQNGGSTTVYVPVLAITGADIAEKFAISGALDAAQPGTVMEIDPHSAGKLRVARGAYTRRVAGVVSGAGDIPTGAILGNLPGFEDAPPVALSGRVWVKCDASQTAIEPGDLLTTSATPGHAMAVRDFTRSPGATLGKAMTPLAKGETGMVLVLVNLQ